MTFWAWIEEATARYDVLCMRKLLPLLWPRKRWHATVHLTTLLDDGHSCRSHMTKVCVGIGALPGAGKRVDCGDPEVVLGTGARAAEQNSVIPRPKLKAPICILSCHARVL